MRPIFAVALVLALAGCAPHVHEDDAAHTPSDDAQAESPAGADADADAGPVLAVLVTREHRVAVRTREGEPLFTVMDREGGVLAESLGLWQLARDYPKLHRQYETAFAGEGIELDASVGDLVRECEGCDGREIER